MGGCLRRGKWKGMMHIFILILMEAWTKVLSVHFFLATRFPVSKVFQSYPRPHGPPYVITALNKLSPGLRFMHQIPAAPSNLPSCVLPAFPLVRRVWPAATSPASPWLTRTNTCSRMVTPFLWADYICICPSPPGQSAGQSPGWLLSLAVSPAPPGQLSVGVWASLIVPVLLARHFWMSLRDLSCTNVPVLQHRLPSGGNHFPPLSIDWVSQAGNDLGDPGFKTLEALVGIGQ